MNNPAKHAFEQRIRLSVSIQLYSNNQNSLFTHT